MRYSKAIGNVVEDQQKPDRPLIPRTGGIAVAFGLFLGGMFYIFVQTFIYSITTEIVILFAALLSLLLITFSGFVDDLLVKKKSNTDYYAGLKQWEKPLLVLPAAIPLMVVNAGHSAMSVPFLGVIEFGLLYPLLLVPIAVFGAANMVNNLAGLNGLEAGTGIIYGGILGYYAYTNGEIIAAVIGFSLAAASLGYYKYNAVPARILGGDSLTYLVGGGIAVLAIVGNMEKAALLASAPFFIEFVLKLRGKLKKQTIGLILPNGKLKNRHGTGLKSIYSIPHIWMRTGKYTEKQINYFTLAFELVFLNLIWFI
ncbi:MAG: hypothetical protein GOV15_03275 [Candidatus Diapherotrites archaeon]|nr:hypothetical protein [Candidatus Diapherotrites archaeon]